MRPQKRERRKDEFDDDDYALAPDLKKRLNYVQLDRDLVEAFEDIDTAPNRAAALARARTSDTHFASFIDNRYHCQP